MTKDIYIFRHGQTDKNLAHIWQGSGSDDLLNANGEIQAAELAQRIKYLGFTRIYSSPLLRAVQTANKIAQYNIYHPEIVILQDLREAYFGDAEGLTFEQVRQKYPDLIDPICNPTFDNWELHYPNGESKQEVFNRVERCLRHIIFSCADSHIGIVCHAGVISALRCGLELEDLQEIGNCSVLHLIYNSKDLSFKLAKN